MAPLLGEVAHHLVQRPFLITVVSENGVECVVLLHGFLGLAFADDLYLVGLAPSQRKFVAKYLIFNRISQRSIENHRHFLSGDETHLNQTFPEAPVAVHLYDDALLSGVQIR